MKFPFIYDSVLRAAITEKINMESHANVVMAITGCSHDEAIRFSIQIPPSFRSDVNQMLCEGMNRTQSLEIISDTILFASWNLSYAGRQLVRKFVGVPKLADITDYRDLAKTVPR